MSSIHALFKQLLELKLFFSKTALCMCTFVVYVCVYLYVYVYDLRQDSL